MWLRLMCGLANNNKTIYHLSRFDGGAILEDPSPYIYICTYIRHCVQEAMTYPLLLSCLM